ncbi:ABC transporter substrate-binding protein [Nocardioides sp. NPDC004968]|uniref:ABC transporter substrate-binding protein n=1 Tax=Nocardioides sp. NPDC004968 TaxID=3155894 RepID=UPI0033BEEEB4
MNRSPACTARRGLAAALVLALPLALGACGGGESADEGAGGATEITVGVIPIVDVAPIYLGVEKGFFKEEGLDVNLELAQGGAAIIPAVASGQYQFGFSNTTSLLLAQTQEVPVKVVTAGVNATDDPAADMAGVLVKAGSDITSPKDLEGKKVAVNTLKNINTTTTNELVRQDGGDPTKIEYVELAFPEIGPAIEKGDVDAGQVVEPFLTIGTQGGMTDLGSNFVAADPGLAVAEYFTSTNYAESDADTVEAFTAAMNESLDYAQQHPDEVKEILPTYTDIDDKVLAELNMPQWTSEIDTESIQKLADLSKADGLFAKDPDVDALLP